MLAACGAVEAGFWKVILWGIYKLEVWVREFLISRDLSYKTKTLRFVYPPAFWEGNSAAPIDRSYIIYAVSNVTMYVCYIYTVSPYFPTASHWTYLPDLIPSATALTQSMCLFRNPLFSAGVWLRRIKPGWTAQQPGPHTTDLA